MSALNVLSDEDAESLRCSKCQYYLNVPPIKSSVDGKVYQCGRCDNDDLKINIRNFAYEKIAKYMMFPCIYPNCSVKVEYTKVQQHEIECIYRTILCPNPDCEQIILCNKIIDHFNECHKAAIMSDVALRFHKLDKGIDLGLLVHDGQPYFCIVTSNGKFFKVGVYSVNSQVNQKFNIDLYTLTFQKRKVSLSGEKIVTFDDKIHCIKCYLGKCNLKAHWNGVFSKGILFEISTELDVVSIRSILKSETICYKISIETNKHLQVTIENGDLIRRITECAICKEYMSPPINCCQTGHIICSNCQKTMSKCPTCLSSFISARNYAVEELCTNVIIPCQNTTCDFVGGLKDLHIHEEKCDSEAKQLKSEKSEPLKNVSFPVQTKTNIFKFH